MKGVDGTKVQTNVNAHTEIEKTKIQIRVKKKDNIVHLKKKTSIEA